MKHVSELVPGDELICYMRMGLALEKVVRGDGSAYRRVPPKPGKVKNRSDALARFTGTVIRNLAEVLTVSVTRMDSMKIGVNDESHVADIHYTAFKRVQLLSKVHTEPFETYGGRPTKREGLGTQRKPFRTLEDVKLT